MRSLTGCVAFQKRKLHMSESFRILPNICSASDQDGTTILDFAGNRIYSVIGMGSVIWSQLASSSRSVTFDELLDGLSNEFSSVSRVQIEQDLTTLLANFRNRALVHPTPESAILETRLRRAVF